jgi:hypothetical protein
VNFQEISFGTPISSLPIDPVNTTSSRNYYTYVTGGSWALAGKIESQKYLPDAAKTNASNSYGAGLVYDPGFYVTGNNTSLSPFMGALVGHWPFDGGTSGSVANNQTSGFED